MNKNIDYWNKILEKPMPIFKNLFNKENNFLIKNISKNAKVLEVGCGNGRNIESIISITKNIIGVDIDKNAVEMTKKRFKNIPEIKIIEGSVFNLPFLEKSFDAIILLLTLVNFEDKKIEALNEMKRVLKEDGKMIISVYSEDSLENRLLQYKEIELPIENIHENKVIFKDLAVAGSSEKFSLLDIENIANKINMEVNSIEKVENIAYIFELKNKM